MTRVEYSDSIPWPVRIVPSSNWAGRYDGGSGGGCVQFGTGSTQLQPVVWSPGEREAEMPPGWMEDGYIEHCVEVDWPALGMWMNLDHKPSNFHGRRSWMGSLLQHGRDPSGQYYRRNRFYDASTGRFTQEDPIGLAGGLNLYGFADGDPVTYSDPYGLCPPIRSCLEGNQPAELHEIATLRKNERHHFTIPIDFTVTATKRTRVTAGFNREGQLIVLLRGGVKVASNRLPDGADRVPINLAAVNVDTGEYDLFGSIGPNLVTANVRGNFRQNTYIATVCVLHVRCSTQSVFNGRQLKEQEKPKEEKQ